MSDVDAVTQQDEDSEPTDQDHFQRREINTPAPPTSGDDGSSASTSVAASPMLSRPKRKKNMTPADEVIHLAGEQLKGLRPDDEFEAFGNRMDSPELPSTDEGEITTLTSQLNDSRKEVAWLKQRIRKLEALFGIAPDEEIPSPATHNATINETMAALSKNATPNHVTTAAFTATTASSSKRNSAQSDTPAPAEAYQRPALAAPAQPTIPAPPRNEPPTATPSAQTSHQSTSSATKPENLPATPSSRDISGTTINNYWTDA
ncbi:unnamed protein product [Hermetia illucens]|uniref:Uncharacterized protein n=1 Tax=Hermetia illucens TaxID=343691 RepID=A0A7R8YL63_HERIL|nr:unnamed protein product [Hermetia illucens]